MLSSKSSRKCERKQKRAQHRLARDMDVQFADSPTQHIAICNAGLVTGLQRHLLEQFVADVAPAVRLSMPPGKSYCFLSFSTVHDAHDFYARVHGIAQVPRQNALFYLIFVADVPAAVADERSPTIHLPPGLRLVEDAISREQELELLQSVQWDEEEENADSRLKHRQVKHYGYKFRYDDNLVDVDAPIAPIPATYQFLQGLLEKHAGASGQYDQLTINRYLPGQGIPAHVDTHSVFEDPILSLSLGSAYVMDFKLGDRRVALDLPARSLLIMSGESRYAWSHGICPRHNDNVWTQTGFSTRPRGVRVSFTFRRIHRGDCQCAYRQHCDSRISNAPIANSVASKLERLYVHHVYDEISGHFNETRHKQWPNVAKFVDSVASGGLLLDVGCGNGKYLHGNASLFKMGCDRSGPLLEICRSRGFQVVLADCLGLPYRSDALDAVLCIAVIHHLSTGERRKQAVSEIVRVLRPGGRALVYVWAKQQNKDSVKSTYLRFGQSKNAAAAEASQRRCLAAVDDCSLPVHENRTEFSHSDMLVPWKRKGGGDFLRYYHVFEEGELERLCGDVPSCVLRSVYYDQGNWCVVIEKT